MPTQRFWGPISVFFTLYKWYHFLLGGLRVTNPTIRLMISVCPSVRPSVRQ